MLELTNIAVPLDAGLPGNERLLRRAAAKKLGVPMDSIDRVIVLKKSVDARKKNDVHFVMTLGVTLLSGSEEISLLYSLVDGEETVMRSTDYRVPITIPAPKTNADIKAYTPFNRFTVPTVPESLIPDSFLRPVVVGTGPAGLFCALYLAKAGLKPLVVERGASVDERVATVERFEETGQFSPVTNIQFGEGGAGTFSDGKLTTNTKNPLTKTVLQWFVEAGAPAEIAVDAKPHIGTDKLRGVVKTMRQQIVTLGGEVRFKTRLVDLAFANQSLSAVVVEDAESGLRETIPTRAVVVATGHSARDTFAMLQERGLFLERKPFSVGVRIEHPQSLINQAQYGPFAQHPALGAADYKLSTHLDNGRGVYTFCMCPGGQVVAATSEEGAVCVNGMSVHARDGQNANSAVLVSVDPSDFPGTDPLAGVEFQRQLEKAAYDLAQQNGGPAYTAPAQRVGDFLRAGSKKGKKPSRVADESMKCAPVDPTYARGVAWSDLHECLPPFVCESLEQALPQFDRKIKGFAADNAVMTAVETRSSSPVRVVRHGETLQASFALDIPATGVFPCGEGAGYAGGIMSAAVDGIKVARRVAQMLSPIDLRGYEQRNKDIPVVAAGVSERLAPSAVVPVGDEQIYEAPNGNLFTYVELSDGSLRILSCKNVTDQIICPAFIQGKLVREMDSSSLSRVDAVRELHLPPGMHRVDAALFRRMKYLELLVYPDVMEMVDALTFSQISCLDTLQMPAMLKRLQVGFLRGRKIRRLRLGKNATSLMPGVFEGSTLEEIEIDPANQQLFTDGKGIYRTSDKALLVLAVPCTTYEVLPGCTRICRKAFATMESLEQVILPETLRTIGNFAFFRSGVKVFRAPQSLRRIEEKAFFRCERLEEVHLNEGLTTIEEGVFEETALHQLHIPASVRYLETHFCGTPLWTNGQLQPLVSVAEDNPVFFVDQNQGLYEKTDQGLVFRELLNSRATIYELDSRTKAVGAEAFSRLSALRMVELPEQLESIGANAFMNCLSLQCVQGSEALRFIDEGAFSGTEVGSLYLPATLEYLGRSALMIKRFNSATRPRSIGQIMVHPQCETFFIEGKFLCQRLDQGGVAALLYLGDERHVVIPRCVTEIRAYCLSNASAVDTIETHDGIELYETDCFLNGSITTQVLVHLVNRPYQGRTLVDLRYPNNTTGSDALRQSFASQAFLTEAKFSLGHAPSFVNRGFSINVEAGEDILPVTRGWSLPYSLKRCDEAMYWDPDVYEKGVYMLNRLSDPFLMTQTAWDRFDPLLRRRLDDFVRTFAQHGYVRGFDQLLSCGYITEENVVHVIDVASEEDNVEVTGHLFELRRRHFGYNVMSEFDL